jgi:hypothetical protein
MSLNDSQEDKSSEELKLRMLKQITWSINRKYRISLYVTASLGVAAWDVFKDDLSGGIVKATISMAAFAIYETAASLLVKRRS